MGISHSSSPDRMGQTVGSPGTLTPQAPPDGDGGQRPISCYPITKKTTLLSPTSSGLALPPRSHLRPSPPLRKRTENRRCWDCIIAPITVIIYTSILPFSLFSARCCNQSHSRGRVAGTCKQVQVVWRFLLHSKS